jgi:Na+-translocating ferredoxin:NAD+ oxidoreductase RnfG subunit
MKVETRRKRHPESRDETPGLGKRIDERDQREHQRGG